MFSRKDSTLSSFDILSAKMRCGVFTNSKGQALIVYDKEIASPIQWVEYDLSENQLYLVHEDGIPQPMGIDIGADVQSHLVNSQKIMLARLSESKITEQNLVSLVIKDY